jgi:hypothetical protein
MLQSVKTRQCQSTGEIALALIRAAASERVYMLVKHICDIVS